MHDGPLWVYLFYLICINTLRGQPHFRDEEAEGRVCIRKRAIMSQTQNSAMEADDPPLQIFHLLIFHSIFVALSELL